MATRKASSDIGSRKARPIRCARSVASATTRQLPWAGRAREARLAPHLRDLPGSLLGAANQRAAGGPEDAVKRGAVTAVPFWETDNGERGFLLM